MRTDEIPVAHTPPGGYGPDMPPPVLAGCVEPLADGAPDMRGMWRAVEVEWNFGPAPDPNPVLGHVERIEQCGDRVVVTSTGVIHDMRADGTVANGVHDVTPEGQAITVVCTFENGAHVLRPEGMPGTEVKRHMEGDRLVWNYGNLFVATLERISE